METEFKKIADKALKNKNIQNRKKLIIFSICLFISLFFWTLKKFSKEYQLTLQYKIHFHNFPSDKVLLNNTDSSFFVTIKSQGFNLIYHQLFNHNDNILIDFSQIKLHENNNNISYLGASQILKVIKKQSDINYNIIGLFPDTFALKWEKAFYKNIAIIPKLKLNFQKQYQLYDSLKITPDSIYISGTKDDISQIQKFYTQNLVLNDLKSNQTAYLNIIKPKQFPKIKLFAEKVKIHLSVEKYTESEIEIPIGILNNTKSQNIKLFPEKVKIKYMVALKDYKKINEQMFTASINTEHFNLSDNKTKISIIRVPEKIKILNIYPEKVEYIIFK